MEKTNVQDLLKCFPLSELKQAFRQMYKTTLRNGSQHDEICDFVADSYFVLTREQKKAVISAIESRYL